MHDSTLLSVADLLDCTASHLRGVSDALSSRIYTEPDDMALTLRAIIDVSVGEVELASRILEDIVSGA